MNFAEYIYPEVAYKLNKKSGKTLAYWKRQAKSNKKCEVCGQPAWRYAGTGLCFICTTGEADASEDYELKPSIED